jgi:DMSO/TMAO reductase YedYZ molybdopterin-dependent catalytic subunit
MFDSANWPPSSPGASRSRACSVAGWSAVGLRWEDVHFGEFWRRRVEPVLPPGSAVTHAVLVGSSARRLVGSSARRLVGSSARRLVGSSARRLVGSSARRLDGSTAIGVVVVVDLLADDVLLADRLSGAPRTGDHGGPLRLVSPSQYAY